MSTPLKDPALRVRRNKAPTAAVTPPVSAVRGPDLPTDHEWHPAVVTWWDMVRASPVAMFYTSMHWAQALDVAELRDMNARNRSGRGWSLIQKASIGLGLDDADRRRNDWRVPVTAAPPESAQVPGDPPAPAGRKRPVRDPRKLLRAVPGGKARTA